MKRLSFAFFFLLWTHLIWAAPITVISSAAYEADHIINHPGTLVALVGYNSSASAQFIQIFNSASEPAEGTTPVITFTVAATSNFSVTIPLQGLPQNVGTYVCCSSTGPTKTKGSTTVFFCLVLN